MVSQLDLSRRLSPMEVGCGEVGFRGGITYAGFWGPGSALGGKGLVGACCEECDVHVKKRDVWERGFASMDFVEDDVDLVCFPCS